MHTNVDTVEKTKLRLKQLAICCLLVGQWQANAFAGETLKGRVAHADVLPTLTPEFAKGQSLKSIKLKPLSPNNVWYRIPDWLAGYWKTSSSTTYFSKDLSSGTKDFSADKLTWHTVGQRGFQRDSKNQIWDYASTGFNTRDDCGTAKISTYVRVFDPVDVSEAKASFRIVDVILLMDPTTYEVSNVSQREIIETITPEGKDMVKCDASIKVFDYSGTAKFLLKAISLQKRDGPFKRQNVSGGLDMKGLFREYLTQHGQLDLLPK